MERFDPVDNALTNNQPWGIGLSVYPANIIGGGGGASNCSTNKTALNIGSCIRATANPPGSVERVCPQMECAICRTFL